MARLSVLKGAVLLVVAGMTHAALGQVIYSDGATHTVPGDASFSNGQSVSLQAASKLVVNGGATINGASGASNQTAGGGIGIAAQAGTGITQNNGLTAGGDATVLGNLSTSGAISATGGTAISSNGTFIGNGGTIAGGVANADGLFASSTLTTSQVGATGGVGLLLSSGATGLLSGSYVIGGDATANNATSIATGRGGAGLRLLNSGSVSINSGTFIGGQGNAEIGYPVVASALGLGAPAVEVVGNSTLTVNAGTFQGGIGSGVVLFFPAPGTGIGGAGIKVTGPAHVTLNGGSFSAGAGGAGTIPPEVPVTGSEAGITVVGDTSPGDLVLSITGGTFRGAHGLETLGTSPNTTNAHIDIFGGDLNVFSGADLWLANPNIETTIYGSGFLLNGSPVSLGAVAATSGTLSGTLSTGATFEWTFQRSNNAALVLAVPEPGFVSTVIVAASVFLRRRQRDPKLMDASDGIEQRSA